MCPFVFPSLCLVIVMLTSVFATLLCDILCIIMFHVHASSILHFVLFLCFPDLCLFGIVNLSELRHDFAIGPVSLASNEPLR